MTDRSSSVGQEPGPRDAGVESPWNRFDWLQFSIFILMHFACLAVFWVGWSPVAVVTAICVYVVQAIGVTAFYHRYFSHRAFKTSRAVQFLGAVMGNLSMQRGVLWWASKHRHHHQHADTDDDVHSPQDHGFMWAHMIWFMERKHCGMDAQVVHDFARFPELRFLDRHPFMVPTLLAAFMFLTGYILARFAPQLGTSGMQMLVWGWLIATMVMNHATFCVNSVTHVFGSRRFETPDTSRNNLWVALATFGEGWHNNHHRYPGSARQGFYWWEIDVTWYLLCCLSWMGLVWDLRQVPEHIMRSSLRSKSAAKSGT